MLMHRVEKAIENEFSLKFYTFVYMSCIFNIIVYSKLTFSLKQTKQQLRLSDK